MRGVRRERHEKRRATKFYWVSMLDWFSRLHCERRGNMWPSLKQTLSVMPGRVDAKIHLTQDKVFMGGPTLVQVQ